MAMAVVPWSYNMKAKGALQPRIKQDVFVNVDGVVKNVLVDDGTMVKKGQVLVELHNPDLELQYQDVIGQKATAQEQLIAVERSIAQERQIDTAERAKLFGQRAQLSQRLTSLEQQEEIIKAKREQLTVRSPIDGQVITWDVKKMLAQRPVSTGQVLMTVADPTERVGTRTLHAGASRRQSRYRPACHARKDAA